MAARSLLGMTHWAIYVHKDNPLKEITTAKIAPIYADDGTITK